MDKVVVDAGPFIHLDQIGHLNLLQHLPALLVPTSVMSELGADARRRHVRVVAAWPHLQVLTVRRPLRHSIRQLAHRLALHRGELDCLALACDHRPATFLTDDLAARTAAQRLGLDVHGTVGLIAYGVRRHWLSVEAACSALERLYHESSLFITYAIIEDAIRRLKASVQH